MCFGVTSLLLTTRNTLNVSIPFISSFEGKMLCCVTRLLEAMPLLLKERKGVLQEFAATV